MTSELYLAHRSSDQSFPLEKLSTNKARTKELDYTAIHNKVERISRKISDHPKDTLWLLNKNEWAHKQLENLTKLQHENKINPENLQRIQNLYQRLINKLIAEIQISPPPLMFKDTTPIKSLDIAETIARFVNSSLDRIVRIIKHGFLFDKIDRLLGDHQRIPPQTILFMEKILNDQNVKDKLKMNPTDYLSNLVDQLATLREEQLKLLKKGKNALTAFDKLSDGTPILPILQSAENLMYMGLTTYKTFIPPADKESLRQCNQVKNILTSLVENAIPLNSQVISDCPIPYTVLEGKNIPGPIGRLLDRKALAEEVEGPQKGFLVHDSYNLYEKVDWREVETQNDVFVKGFYRIQFLTSEDNHVAMSGAWLDLSPFKNLDKANVRKIFDLLTYVISKDFEILNVPKDRLSEKQIQVKKEFKKKIKALEKEIGLPSKEIKKLHKVILDFCYRMKNAMTLTLLTVNHDTRKSSLRD